MKKIFVSVTGALLLVSLLLSGLVFSRWDANSAVNASALVAYNIDLEMDQARQEKTVEHYGEGIRDIVEDASKNNVNNPDSKSTAENTYQRENPVIDALPNQIGKDFSKEDLQHMENADKGSD